ncbi:hypothetical protein B0H13DRAFT_2431540 [Mycena leptocephala]|nr:hypothetical protein B0H13DRAFT_2431540 [Mycena leptocephala]
MPSLATAKAYLPQAVAAYLPDSTPAPSASESSLPPLPPSSRPCPRAPRGRTSPSTSDTSRIAPRLRRRHLQHHCAHGALLLRHRASFSLFLFTPSFCTPRHLRPPPLAPRRRARAPSVSTLDSDAAANTDVDLTTPQLVQSPIPLAPGESTDLALAAESSSSAPSSLMASASTTQERDHPRPTSGLLPSHPGVARVHAEPATNVNAVPTQSLDGVHPTPHVPMPDPAALGLPAFGEAASSTSTSLASTPSLVPPSLTGGESGYAASSESIPTPGSESMPAPALTTLIPTPTAPANAYGGAHGGGGIQGGAALNSSRFEDNVPTGDFTPRLEVQGSAALNSSRVEDNVPTGDMELSPNKSEEADDDASSGSNSENVVDADASADADGDGTKKSKKTKKPKLMQRLKERMHVGGGGGGSA